MDKTSQLPDELLLKVLMYLPTKVAVSTSILSKRWEFLWMWLPKLEYDFNEYSMDERKRLRNFINLNMPLHRAPVIESLRLKLSDGYRGMVKPEDITLWVVIAVSRFLRELSLDLYTFDTKPIRLPSSLYTCKSLVILKLTTGNHVDVPRTSCLPALKTLLLQGVAYANEKSLHKLLSSCPILEDLCVEQQGYETHLLKTVNVIVPSLQRLTLKLCTGYFFKALVLNTPSLKYFKVTDYSYEYCNGSDDDDNDVYSFFSDDMAKLEEMEVDSTHSDIGKFVSLITYVKRLSLCLGDKAEEVLNHDGIIFSQLQNLKLCSCTRSWSKLLVRFLKNSPNLQELEIYLTNDHKDKCEDLPVCWENELDCVPGCLLSSLETFKWTTGIYGSQEEIGLVKYVLRNGFCLKKVTILFRSSDSALEDDDDELEMVIQDLSLSSRGSKDVKLEFA